MIMKEEKMKNRTAILLAGGKSTRMGSDKGLLRFRNKPFIQYSIDAVRPLVDDIIIVSNSSDYDQFDTTRVADIIPDSGPVGGLHSGLLHSTTTNNIVLSCDAPLITTHLLQKLIDHEKKDTDVVVLRAGQKIMPLIATYQKRCAQLCEEHLKSNTLRLRDLISKLNTKIIHLPPKEHALVVNINTKDELNQMIHATTH